MIVSFTRNRMVHQTLNMWRKEYSTILYMSNKFHTDLIKLPSLSRAVLLNQRSIMKTMQFRIPIRQFSGTSFSLTIQRPVVICGPSGTGKTTMINKLMSDFPDVFGLSVSHTTRKPRKGEVDGVNYHFVSESEFCSGVKRGDFIEVAEFSGNMYATSKLAIQEVQEKGQICILDLEMKGVKQIKENKDINPLYIFIRPPSITDLVSRLKGRKTETEESLAKRLYAAKLDLDNVENSNLFDAIITNHEVSKATRRLAKFILRDIKTQCSSEMSESY